MARTIAIYAGLLALAATLLQWADYRYAVRAFSTEVYIALLALGFVMLGVWLGIRLTPAPPSERFERNDRAIASLGLSPRECEVLDALADGLSNKEIARRLGISPNTVKTHVAALFAKLDVGRRIQAIAQARRLSLIR